MERIRLERKTEYRNVARFTCDNCGKLIDEIIADKYGNLDKSKVKFFTISDRRTITTQEVDCYCMYQCVDNEDYVYIRHYCSKECRDKLEENVRVVEAYFDKYESYMAESKNHDPYNVIAEKHIDYGKKLKPILEDCGYVRVE